MNSQYKFPTTKYFRESEVGFNTNEYIRNDDLFIKFVYTNKKPRTNKNIPLRNIPLRSNGDDGKYKSMFKIGRKLDNTGLPIDTLIRMKEAQDEIINITIEQIIANLPPDYIGTYSINSKSVALLYTRKALEARDDIIVKIYPDEVLGINRKEKDIGHRHNYVEVNDEYIRKSNEFHSGDYDRTDREYFWQFFTMRDNIPLDLMMDFREDKEGVVGR